MTRALRSALDTDTPNNLADASKAVLLGTALAVEPITLITAVASSKIVLPNNRKARQLIRVFATVGTVTGYLIIDPTEATPATGHVIVNQLGNIEFAAADAITKAEVTYIPLEGDLVTETITVVPGTGVGTLLNGKTALMLISAQALTGTLAGVEIVDVRAASAPATGHAKLNLLGQATFAVADGVTTATVTYIAAPSVGTATLSLADRLDSLVAF